MRRFFSYKRSYFLILAFPIIYNFLNIHYFSNLFEGFFSVDDFSLVGIPQLRAPLSFQLFKTLFTPGLHIDYYPVRDLSYWIDLKLGAASESTFVFKMMNYGYFYIFLVFTYLIFFKILGDSVVSLIATLAWGINPFHNEMIYWVSARKDLLYQTFSVVSFFYFLSEKKSETNQNQNFIFGLIFYVLACFSKAAGILLIFLWPFYYFFQRKRPAFFYFKSILIFCLGITFIVINKYNYAQVNNMYFYYSSEYRFEAVITSIGRVCVGFFLPYANTIDTENWGKWIELNKDFFFPGLIFSFFIFTSAVYFLLREKRYWSIFLFLLLSMLSIPGINQLHRSFYSVRYFEFSILIFYGMSIFYFYSYTPFKKYLKLLLAALLFWFCSVNWIDSYNWESNLKVAEKALSLTPENPNIIRQYLSEYESTRGWGKNTFEDDRHAELAAVKLLSLCSDSTKNSRNGSLCFHTWASKEDFFSFSFLNAVSGRQLDKFNKSIDDLSKLSGSSRDRVLQRYSSFDELLAVNGDVMPEKNIVKASEKMRFLHLSSLCLKEDKMFGKQFIDFNERYLISRKGFVESISPLKEPLKSKVIGCFSSLIFKI